LKKILIILSTICSAYVCSAQVVDDFSDEDYTINPTWSPDDANNWTVVNGRLRSNSAIASSSFFLTTPSTTAVHAQWEFFVELQFNTSSANFVDVYLMADQANLTSPTNNGYFVRIGGTPDEISLYKLMAGTNTLLINGTDGVTNRSTNLLRIKVVRDENNSWSLEHDASGGNNYSLEGTATDNTFSSSNFLGIRIQQSTSGFFNRHFFDDIYAGDIATDILPPSLTSVEVLSANRLSLAFNEPLDTPSSQTKENYQVSDAIGQPIEAQLQSDKKTVVLTFAQSFANGTTHTIDITGVQDLAGNVMEPMTQSFLFFQGAPVNSKDIILTEIMADPSPQVGLPEAEFIEIYNRSANTIDLQGWKFSDGNSVGTFPSHLLLPNHYAIICSTTSVALLSSFPNVVGISNFPSLNNSGESLTLTTSEGLLIDSVNYSLSWYRDEDKQEGGWTLELIDTNNPCGEDDNWMASEDDQGGTPGQTNSVNANKPDLTGPKLLSVTVISPHELLLRFDEKLEKFLSQISFQITPDIDIAASSFTNSSLREITLSLLQDLNLRQLYSLEVKDLRDCNGNAIQEAFNQVTFALPELAAQGDVLINEILFNPLPGGVDFVEVINVSSKYLNLKNWSIANYTEEQFTNLQTISESDYTLAPGGYLALTPSITILKSQYLQAQEEYLLSTLLPSMNDDAGAIAILTDEGDPLDVFEYMDAFHSPMLKDKEGVSLERISLTESTMNPGNWKSANSSAGFATPGYLNSNSSG
jgi:Lamin Tail Domain/Bacterial Ig-like domain